MADNVDTPPAQAQVQADDAKASAKAKKANAAASRDKHRQIEKAHRDRMRQLMHDLARHVYNGNRTEEELSNMTRGDILMAAKECITQLRRKLGAARTGAPMAVMPQGPDTTGLATSAVPMNAAATGMPPQQMMQQNTGSYTGPGSISSGDARSSAVAALMGAHTLQRPAASPGAAGGMPPGMAMQQQPHGMPPAQPPPAQMQNNVPSQAASAAHSANGQQAPPSIMSAPAAGWQGGGGNTVDTQGRRDTGLSGGPLSVWSASESFRQGAVPGAWQNMPGWGPGGHGQPSPMMASNFLQGGGSVHGGSIHGSVASMPHHLMQAGGWQGGMYPGPMLPTGGMQQQWQQQTGYPPNMNMQAGQGHMPASAPNTTAMSAGMTATMTAPLHTQPGGQGGRPPVGGGTRRLEPSPGGAADASQGAAKRARPMEA